MPSFPSIRIALLSFLLTAPARAGWFDAAWPCRRTVDVAWNADTAAGNELAQVELYTDGHALPTLADLRVATDDGKPVPFRVMTAGPGDRARLVFALAKGFKRYGIYFGNPTPPPPPPEAQLTSGLLMESRAWNGGPVRTFDQIERSWNQSGPDLGRILVDHPFIGFNPFDDRVQVIDKLTGTLTAPVDGEYLIAMAVDDEGGLYLDGKPTLFAHLGGADIRYHVNVHLDRGPHAFLLYHVNVAGTGYFSVGWQRPETPKVSVIEKFAFGSVFQQANLTVGPLEMRGRTLVADFAPDRVAECPLGERYVFHYRFTGQAHISVPVTYAWDFGDGQSAAGTAVDHVYLRDGLYTVRCTAHAGPNTDVQTSRVVVGRDYAHLPLAHEDPPGLLSSIVAGYRLADVRPEDLPRAVQLHLAADRPDPALAAATAIASLPVQPDPPAALVALSAVQTELVTAGHPETAVTLWERVTGDLRPTAAAHAADLSLWWLGDADGAFRLLEPAGKHGSNDVRRLYAQAALLAGHADDARSILADLPSRATGSRRAALSGADARSVEFYITEGEPDAGDAAWARWMSDFPTDFATGYSMVLRAKLMELRHRDAAAAAVAEAFANAVPTSSYAPQLLDRASRLLAKTDPAKSAALRQQLKQKYPEDPLSQN